MRGENAEIPGPGKPLHWRSPSVLALLTANAIPLFGVLFLGWEIFPIMVLYWAENVIIGVFNVLKILTNAGPGGAATQASKLFFVPFFTVHYGVFTLVHGVFVFTLFGGSGSTMSGPPVPIGKLQTELDPGILLVGLGLVGSHGYSLITNYFGRGEFKRLTIPTLMFAPYPRIVILHISILVGGFLTMFLGAPTLAIALLVILKSFVDVKLHLREHNGSMLPGKWQALSSAIEGRILEGRGASPRRP
ncbi:MAG: DUF6498-containing protein [Verrucomicrobiota bacterium]